MAMSSPIISRVHLVLVLAVLIGSGGRDGLLAQQSGTFRGIVIALETGHPLPGTRVMVVGTDIETTTDATGSFELANLPAGQVVLRFQRIGFARLTERVVVQPESITAGLFEMPSHTHVLDAIGITARSPEEGGGRKALVAGEQVQRYHSLERAVDGVSGVELVRTSGQVGAGFYIRIRGVSSMTFSSNPAVFIDGIRINLTFASGSSLDLINPSQVGRVEVLRGPAAAARYGPDAVNGVILISTRRGNQ